MVDKDALKQKLMAPTKLAKIKGVYDLLIPREEQALYAGKGKGKYKAVPPDVKEAMKGKHLFPFSLFHIWPHLF